jgi:putative hemolysin
MSSYLQLLTYFLISHSVSLLCSLLEAVLLSCNPHYASQLEETNPRLGKELAKLRKKINEPLAAILTLNTAAHTFGAAGIGATVESLFGSQYLMMCSIIVTLTMLYGTEMIPKTYGALYWKRLIPYCIPVIRALIILTYPFVYSFNLIAEFFKRDMPGEIVSEIEIKALIRQGTLTGTIEPSREKMLFRVLELSDSRAHDFLISRSQLHWIPLNASQEQIDRTIQERRAEVYFLSGESDSKPKGVVYPEDLLAQRVAKGRYDLSSIAQETFCIPENATILTLLEKFNDHKEKICFVIDEYGEIEGAIQLNDILYEVVRDICSSLTLQEHFIVRRRDGSWIMQGSLPIADLANKLGISFEKEESERGDYRTLAGFCLKQFQEIPRVGDQFNYADYQFRIIGIEEQRISRVLVQSYVEPCP